jgi:hypothetical protein
MGSKSCLPKKALGVFASLNAVDLLLTWALFQCGEGTIYESNPVAQSCLAAYGWVGVAIFKTTTTGIAGCSLMLVSLHRPRIGHLALTLGCALIGAVALYSYCLLTELIH